MANIDTSTIEGFDTLSAEEQVQALLGLEIPDAVDMSKFVDKSLFDKKASELAEANKKLKDKMSDDEKKKAEDEKALEEMRMKIETLEKEKMVSNYTAQFLALGYDDALAKETAQAQADGDMAKVFANSQKHQKALEEKLKKEMLDKTPKPGGNGGGDDDGDKDEAVEKAKAIAKAKVGDGKSYDDIMNNYR